MKEIPLTQGKVALVDDDVFEFLNQWIWHTQKDKNRFCAFVHIGKFPSRKAIKMHRIIMNAPNGMEVDHWDGDGLNNQRNNLRICTKAQNQHNRRKNANNTSGYKGVSFDKKSGKFRAYININGKRTNLGFFTDPIAAANTYNQAACKSHGEFAKINLLEQRPE